jgi:antitoxin CptB
MYNTHVVTNKLEIFKKRLIYRASYRGTKEMDILLTSFVNKYINKFNDKDLLELEKFLNFEDDIIINFYNFNIVEKKIDENKISKIFKSHKI